MIQKLIAGQISASQRPDSGFSTVTLTLPNKMVLPITCAGLVLSPNFNHSLSDGCCHLLLLAASLYNDWLSESSWKSPDSRGSRLEESAPQSRCFAGPACRKKMWMGRLKEQCLPSPWHPGMKCPWARRQYPQLYPKHTAHTLDECSQVD